MDKNTLLTRIAAIVTTLAETNGTVYECAICKSLNHVSRVHCATCGTIPSRYSILGKPMDASYSRESVAAIGCKRAAQHHQRLRLWTVETTYYAQE